MLAEMVKLRVVAARSHQKSIIETLWNLGAYHIQEPKELESVDIGKPDENASEYAKILVSIQSVATKLGIILTDENIRADKEFSAHTKRLVASKALKLVGHLEETVLRNLEEREEFTGQIARLHNKQSLLSQLSRLGVPQHLLCSSQALGFFIGSSTKAQLLVDALTAAGLRLEVAMVDKIVAVWVAQSDAEKVQKIISLYDWMLITLDHEMMEQDFSDQLDLVKSQIHHANKELARLEHELGELRGTWRKKLALLWLYFSCELEKAQAPLLFLATKNAFVIDGFVPREKSLSIQKELMRHTKGALYLKESEVEEHDDVPIAFKNPRITSPFQFFLELYTLPKYSEIDPTLVLFIGFPLLFGFMLGDWGYGLFGLVVFSVLAWKFPSFKAFFQILIVTSIASIIFGFAFSEFFGFEEVFGIHPLISRNPEHHLEPLMAAAVIMGILHINLGLLIGFFEKYKHHGFFHAFLEKISWMVLQAGVALAALSHLHLIPLLPAVGYGVITLSIVMLWFGEGVRGLVEIPGIFGNILSYLRLMAIGLSSVGLALVINEMTGDLVAQGGIALVGGIILFVVGHIVNIGIGIMGSFLHSLRLQYVEFFTKFYSGGGKQFMPFGRKTEEE